MLRLRDVRDRLAILGIGIGRTAWDEYRVFYHKLNGVRREATAYYSNDLEDCLFTGLAMSRQPAR